MDRLASLAEHLKHRDGVLIANRGEIAARISRAVAAEGLRSIAIYGKDDEKSLHVARCDESFQLKNKGTAAYLDPEDIVKAAKETKARYIAPGYGFLSESSPFAKLCEDKGITFIGPTPQQLEMFGDKSTARKLAVECKLPILEGTIGSTSLDDAKRFMQSLPPGSAVMVKALAGGGGRGMRAVNDIANLTEAYNSCRSEAAAAFGPSLDGVYLERLVKHPRHVEIQVIGDGTGNIQHLWERDCTLQRRHQKLVEIAPAPNLNPAVREKAINNAVKIAGAVKLRSLATVEFLLDTNGEQNSHGTTAGNPDKLFFMEVNPRLQVEHTVTEMVTDLDLVRLQLAIARGATLEQIGLAQPPPAPRQTSIQVRINAETLQPDGSIVPSIGKVSRFEPPSGRGIRLDTATYSGYMISPYFDSLLAKLIVTSSTFQESIDLARRALEEFFISGIDSNINLLRALVSIPEVTSYNSQVSTHFVEQQFLPDYKNVELPRTRFLNQADLGGDARGNSDSKDERHPSLAHIENLKPFKSLIGGTVKELHVEEGAKVLRGSKLVTVEAMKMEHSIKADEGGVLRQVNVAEGDIVQTGSVLFWIEPSIGDDGDAVAEDKEIDPDYIRPDLQKVYQVRSYALPENRPKAVQKRHSKGHRFIWENIHDLFTDGSFVEYGSGAVAAQSRRRALDDLQKNTIADGVVTGIGTLRDELAEAIQRAILIAYDYTVLAGTQGYVGHHKHDRLLQVAEKLSLPVVVYGEGGGGRPGDVDANETWGSGLLTSTFGWLAKLSGQVPLVAVVNGNCFAGNAALVGVCDVLIVTEKTYMGMAGPKMIEGGGLGLFKAEEIGPSSMQNQNGVIDILVKDEAEATHMVKKYLSYFLEPLRSKSWTAKDQRPLRHLVPENRRIVYDMRTLVYTIADEDTVIELRPKFGHSLFTFLIRLEGRSIGVVASNPNHLGGAIDSNSADKGARFMCLCDAFDIPILTLVDTPGFMVGPDAEKTAQVRHFGRLFVSGATCTSPFLSLVIRKAIGLGAQAILQGDLHAPVYTAAWPTASLAPMGIEGGVRLGFKQELDAIPEGPQRDKRFDELVEESLVRGSALTIATVNEVDEVLDPAETRQRLVAALKSCPVAPRPFKGKKKRTMVDTW